MVYIVFDLEATCWEKRDNSPNETIEIGAVMINEKKEIIAEFEQFVKPLKHPILSDFCKELTSIRQDQVDNAPYFGEAKDNFLKWITAASPEYVLCSWGFYDKKQFQSDCQIYGIDTAWIEPHISLKHQHGKIMNLRRPIGMKRALQQEGLFA